MAEVPPRAFSVAVRAGGAPAGPGGGGAQAERVIVMVPSQVWEWLHEVRPRLESEQSSSAGVG